MVARGEPAAVASDRDEWWLLDRLALASSLISGLVLYALIGRGGWYVDDFLNFGLARESPFSRHYLGLAVFGHLQPGTRLANWLLYRIAPMNYHLASALVCLSVAFAAWMLYRTLRLAFRPSPWHLLLTAVAGGTALWVPVAAWWAGGSEIAGCLVANVLVVHALLHCYRGPRRVLWAVLAACWLVVGLAFYERALIGGVFAVWFVLAVGARSARPRELLRVLRQAWTGCVALLVVAIGYLYVYATHRFVHSQPGYTRAEVLHFLWVCWSHTLIPSLFGGTLRTGRNISESFATPPLWWLTLCQLALLALVGYGILRNRVRSVLAWLVFLVLFVPAQYAIATARLHVHGPSIGDEFRYLADLLPLLLLTVGVTVLRRRLLPVEDVPATVGTAADADPAEVSATDASGSTPAEETRPADEPRRRRWVGVRRAHLIATGAALVVVWTVFWISALPVSHRWLANRGIRYVNNLRAELPERDRQGPWSLYTTFAPQTVSPIAWGRYSSTPSIAALVGGHQVSVDDLSKPMYVVDGDGHLRPARFESLASAPGVCSTQQQRIMQPVSRVLAKGLWNVQLSYRVATPTTLRFALDPGTGVPVEATGSFRGFRVSGSGRLTFALRQTAVVGFRLDAAVAGVCISDVQLGRPVPAG
jgi:hypothetical protein